jgi:hypothetical protein
LPSHFKRLPIIAQYSQIFIDTSILALNAPLRRFPRVQSERLFLACTILLSLNIVSIFQSQLATCYVKPMYYKNIETLKQFADTKQRILIKYPAMMTDVFPEDSSELFNKLNERMFLHPNMSVRTTFVVKEMGYATVTRRTTLKVTKEENFVHAVSECPRSYNLAFVYTKHSVFAHEINSIILNLKQAGIINKWISDVNFQIKLEAEREMPSSHVMRKVLKVDDLVLAFMILGSGIFVGCLILFVEILMKFFCTKRKQNSRGEYSIHLNELVTARPSKVYRKVL